MGNDKKTNDGDTIPEVKYSGGPEADRSCQDIICCLIFIAYMVSFYFFNLFYIYNSY